MSNNAQKETWRQWLKGQRAKATLQVKQVSIFDVMPWAPQILKNFIIFGRPLYDFFWLIGVMVYNAGREVDGWKQILIREPEHGWVIIACDPEMEHFLLCARVEPGNPATKGRNRVLIGAPAQMSESNRRAAHEGKVPPRYEFTVDPTLTILQSIDGGKFIDKYNNLGYVIREDLFEMQLLPGERIFTRNEFFEARRAGECNSHALEVAGMMFN